jgi:hypothetical protein
MNKKLRSRAIATISAVGATGIGAMALHGGAWGAIATGAAGIIMWHCEDVLEKSVKSVIMHDEVRAAEEFVERIMPEPEVRHEDQRVLSKLKRLVGIDDSPQPSLEHRYDEQEQSVAERGNTMPALTPQQRISEVRRNIIPPRPIQQPSQNFADDVDASVYWGESWSDDDDVQPLPSTTKDNGMFTFSQILDKGFAPSLNKIYLGRLTDGTDVYVTAKDLCHVALAGLTGNGKSSIMRLIMAQLCKIGVTVLLLNPHYMQWDHSGGEDWTPYEPYLEKSPTDCAIYETIGTYLEWAAKTLLSKRIERARVGKPIGKPFFIVVDELPAIVAECKDVPSHIAKLLREGRKFGIFLIVASQDFQVKTIGFEGGGVRKCFKTAFYVGGDVATAKALLNDDNQKDPIPENDLGKGTIMLRCSATKKAVLTKVPYVDNESLYRLLGKSTFSPADEKPLISEQSKTTLDLDTVLALAESEKIDGETLLALINRLPDRGKDIDTEELLMVDDEAKQVTRFDEEPLSPDKKLNSSFVLTKNESILSPSQDILKSSQQILTPIIPDKGPRAKDIDLDAAILLWNSGYRSEDKLMKAFGLTKYQAGLLRDRIMERVPVSQDLNA